MESMPGIWFRLKQERERVKCETSADPLSDIELERLEPAADGGTAGTLPSGSVLLQENLDAGLAEAADALGARIRATQLRDVSACGAVYLGILRGIVGRRVG